MDEDDEAIIEANRETEERNGWAEYEQWIDETYGVPV
jgi:hypothetical protein